MSPIPARPQPCESCPYRKDTPPGVWHPSEYGKLAHYGRETGAQPTALFVCHHSNDVDGREQVCRGWLATETDESLAVRLAIATGRLDPDERYRPVVAALYPTHDAAAIAGLIGCSDPDERARALADRLLRKRTDGR